MTHDVTITIIRLKLYCPKNLPASVISIRKFLTKGLVDREAFWELCIQEVTVANNEVITSRYSL